jgi:hypothetical protein
VIVFVSPRSPQEGKTGDEDGLAEFGNPVTSTQHMGILYLQAISTT